MYTFTDAVFDATLEFARTFGVEGVSLKGERVHVRLGSRQRVEDFIKLHTGLYPWQTDPVIYRSKNRFKRDSYRAFPRFTYVKGERKDISSKAQFYLIFSLEEWEKYEKEIEYPEKRKLLLSIVSKLRKQALRYEEYAKGL